MGISLLSSGFLLFIVGTHLFFSCGQPEVSQSYNHSDGLSATRATTTVSPNVDSSESKKEWDYSESSQKVILTGNTTPDQLLSYAETLQGIPYKYGSIDPDVGFDCSGFITHLFNYFNIAVPRSSKDFTNIEHEIPIGQAKKGDIILFTGTDSTIRVVGHMGVISSHSNEEIKFIHSTSGKADGVTITPLNTYYQGRFVKIIRIFNDR